MRVAKGVAAAALCGALLLAWTQPSPAAGNESGHADHDAASQADHGAPSFVCPMHPQISEPEPGSCPICGMDLEKHETDLADPAASAASKQREIKHWVAPMDPGFVSDRPGKSPMGMDLLPVYESGGQEAVVKVDPVVVQNMGVRVSPARRGTIFRHVRTIGTVEVAEDLLSVVNLRYSGWIERIHVDETGVLVEKGQPLFDIYSPELVSAQDEYVMALRTSGAKSALTSSTRSRLEFWNLGDAEINRIAGRGKALRTITVTAPRQGYVLHKEVVQGARVEAGADLYRIADMDRVWIYAEVYEFDAPWVKLGDRATMELTFQRGKTYEGSVTHVYPTLDPKTRTLKVRLEFENPGIQLKPGMFSTVRIDVQRINDVIMVPTEAIIHTGERQLVFVALDVGRYEMREIVSGVAGDRYVTEIVSGLSEGERVVTSGQFLLDSESQLQEAVQKFRAARLHADQPGAGSGLSQTDTDEDAGGQSYWSCGMHPHIVEDGPGTCPICGMDLVEKGS